MKLHHYSPCGNYHIYQFLGCDLLCVESQQGQRGRGCDRCLMLCWLTAVTQPAAIADVLLSKSNNRIDKVRSLYITKLEWRMNNTYREDTRLGLQSCSTRWNTLRKNFAQLRNWARGHCQSQRKWMSHQQQSYLTGQLADCVIWAVSRVSDQQDNWLTVWYEQ